MSYMDEYYNRFYGELVAEKAVTTGAWVAIPLAKYGWHMLRSTTDLFIRSAADDAAGTITALDAEQATAEGGASSVPDVFTHEAHEFHRFENDEDVMLVRAVTAAGRVRVRRLAK